MRKHLLPLSFVALVALALPATAQQKPSGKMGEYDEIVIKRKGGENAKVTVEIKDGEVFVDGKKLEDYKNDDIAVLHRSIRPRNGGMMAPEEGIDIGRQMTVPPPPPAPAAVLGVMTSKQEATGATITMVSEGSAAEKAGLKEGDVITSLNAKEIREPQELFEAVGALKPGDRVTVTYKRNGKESKTTAVLGKRERVATFDFTPRGEDSPFGRGTRPSPFRGGDDDDGPYFRMPEFEQLHDGFRNRGGQGRLGLSVQDTEEGDGAKVLHVAPDSPADKAGFQENDIVTEMAGKPVTDAKDVAETYKANKDKGNVDAKVKRDGKVQKLSIKIPKKLNTENL